MKQTGIIMSGDHPSLVMEEKKTMTRRTWGLEEINKNPDKWEYMRTNNDGRALFWLVADDPEPDIEKRIKLIKCPYGQVGDRLWVRETWCQDWDMNGVTKSVVYKASAHPSAGFTWKPSRFMPRWASRADLEITGLRAERVQDISYLDAGKEGLNALPEWMRLAHFHELWDSLNAKRGYSWEVNPWLWVISFRRLNG